MLQYKGIKQKHDALESKYNEEISKLSALTKSQKLALETRTQEIATLESKVQALNTGMATA